MVFENSSPMMFAGQQGRFLAAMGRFPGCIEGGPAGRDGARVHAGFMAAERERSRAAAGGWPGIAVAVRA
jgi:hypothetical protein